MVASVVYTRPDEGKSSSSGSAPPEPDKDQKSSSASKAMKVSLELPERLVKRLKALSEFEGRSCGALIERALCLHEYVVKEQMKGGKLLLEKPDGTLRRVTFEESV